jgi:hypothetical protein
VRPSILAVPTGAVDEERRWGSLHTSDIANQRVSLKHCNDQKNIFLTAKFLTDELFPLSSQILMEQIKICSI